MRRNKKRITIGIILLVFYFLPSFLPFLNVSEARSKSEDQPTVLFCSKPIEHGRKSRKEVIKEYIQLVFLRNPTAKEVKIEVLPNDRNTKINYYESLEGDFDFRQFSKDKCDYEFCLDICVPTCYKVDALEFTLKSKDGILLLSSNSNKGLSIFPLSREINVINVESCEDLAKIVYASIISAYSFEVEKLFEEMENVSAEVLKMYVEFYKELMSLREESKSEEVNDIIKIFAAGIAGILSRYDLSEEKLSNFVKEGNNVITISKNTKLSFSSVEMREEIEKKILEQIYSQIKNTGKLYERSYAIVELWIKEGEKVRRIILDVEDITLESMEDRVISDLDKFKKIKNIFYSNENIKRLEKQYGIKIHIPKTQLHHPHSTLIDVEEVLRAFNNGKAVMVIYTAHIHPRETLTMVEWPSPTDLISKFVRSADAINSFILERGGRIESNRFFLLEGHFNVLVLRTSEGVFYLDLASQTLQLYDVVGFYPCFKDGIKNSRCLDDKRITNYPSSLFILYKDILRNEEKAREFFSYFYGENINKVVYFYGKPFFGGFVAKLFGSYRDDTLMLQLLSVMKTESSVDEINNILRVIHNMKTENINDVFDSDEYIKFAMKVKKDYYDLKLNGEIKKVDKFDVGLEIMSRYVDIEKRFSESFFQLPQSRLIGNKKAIALFSSIICDTYPDGLNRICMKEVRNFLSSQEINDNTVKNVLKKNLLSSIRKYVEKNYKNLSPKERMFLFFLALNELDRRNIDFSKSIAGRIKIERSDIENFISYIKERINDSGTKLALSLNYLDYYINRRELLHKIDEQIRIQQKKVSGEIEKLIDDYMKSLKRLVDSRKIKIDVNKLNKLEELSNEYKKVISLKNQIGKRIREIDKELYLQKNFNTIAELANIRKSYLDHVRKLFSDEILKETVSLFKDNLKSQIEVNKLIDEFNKEIQKFVTILNNAKNYNEIVEVEKKFRLELAKVFERLEKMLYDRAEEILKEFVKVENELFKEVNVKIEDIQVSSKVSEEFKMLFLRLSKISNDIKGIITHIENSKITKKLKDLRILSFSNLKESFSSSLKLVYGAITGDVVPAVEKTVKSIDSISSKVSKGRAAILTKVFKPVVGASIAGFLMIGNHFIHEKLLENGISAWIYTSSMSVLQTYYTATGLSYISYLLLTGRFLSFLKTASLFVKIGVITTLVVAVVFSILCLITENTLEGFGACFLAYFIGQPMCRYDKGKYAVTEKSRIPKDEEYKDPRENTIFLLKTFSDKITFWAKDIPLINTKTCPPSWLWYIGEGVYVLLKYRESVGEKVISKKIKIREDGSGSVEFKIEKPLTYFITLEEVGTVFGAWRWTQTQKIGYLSFEECKGKIVDVNKVYAKDQIINILDENRVCINPCPNFNCPRGYECSDGICTPKEIIEKEKCKKERKYYDAKSGKCCDRGICVIDRGIFIPGCIYPEDESIAIEAIMMCYNNPRSRECIEKAEELKKKGYGSSITKLIPSIIDHTACCSKNQCVFEGKCYNTNSRINIGNNRLICDNGIWKVSGCEIGEARWDGYNLVIPFSNCKLSELKGYAYVDVEKIVKAS